MKDKKMIICPRCRGEREGVLNFKEDESSALMRRKCEWCGKKFYGKAYFATDAWLQPVEYE